MALLARFQLLMLVSIMLCACAGSSINVNIKGEGGVLGKVNGALGINCGNFCLYSQTESFNMSLTAITKEAQTFISWEGDGNVSTKCGINPVCDVLVPPFGNFNITANFGEVDLGGGRAISCQLGILDVSGINPYTGQPWKAGDKYRLIFVTSTSRDATSTNIDDYNTFVQTAANAAGLGSVSWYAVGSTETV